MKLTPVSKIILVVILALAGAFGYYKYQQSNPSTKAVVKADKSTSKSITEGITSIFKGGDELTVIVNTWGGFASLAYLTDGSLTPNENSRIYTEYGIKLNIKICDVFEDSRNVFKNTENAIVYCTTDALPVEMGAGSAMSSIDVQQFAQVDWSRGGDMIVVRRGINSVADLKGKTIAVAMGTASNTFLIKTLEANGLSLKDVVVKQVADGIEAAKLFKAGTVDASVVWTPDDGDCLAAIVGSKRLIGTETASYIIADGLLARKDFIEKNNQVLVKFLTAWLVANGELNSSASARTKAAKDFAKAFNVDEGFAMNGISKVRFTTLGDNMNFFGLNSQYTGVNGEQLYSKMSIVYSDLKLTNKPLAWRSVSNTSIVEAISTTLPNQSAEAAVTFKPATEELENKVAFSNKKVTINFASGSAFLSDDAQSIIDREFVDLAKSFNKARIRIEGNCDAVGSDAVNQPLSEKRAQAVANYLMKTYKFDVNRFMVQGNGSKKAREAGVNGASEFYRMTEFQLVAE